MESVKVWELSDVVYSDNDETLPAKLVDASAYFEMKSAYECRGLIIKEMAETRDALRAQLATQQGLWSAIEKLVR